MATSRVVFLGAGASVADGYPITSQLIYPVAAGAMSEHRRARHGSRFVHFLGAVYGVDIVVVRELAKDWRRLINAERPAIELSRRSDLPDIIELLSQIDLAISTGASFGPTVRKNGMLPRILYPQELRLLRIEVEHYLSLGLAHIGRYYRTVTGASRLVSSLTPSDTVITTNWDTLIDRALRRRRLLPDYGSPSAVSITYKGNEITPKPSQVRRLLKLHGSLNWLTCQRCNRLYANQDADIAFLDRPGDKLSIQNICDCGDRLRRLLITPSYAKNYESVHIAATWRQAAICLMEADEWYFAGYSFPSDDLMIRSLLLRCLSTRRDQAKVPPWEGNRKTRKMPEIAAFMHSSDPADILARPRVLFGQAMARSAEKTGFSGLIGRLQRTRSSRA